MEEPDKDAEAVAEDALTVTRILSAPKALIHARWPMKAEVLGGPMDGMGGATERQTLTIGRGEENDLVLMLDPAVSSQHARLHREDERYWLEDLESRNGTFLGTQRVQGRVPIGRGTMFTVGRTRLEFLVG